MKATEEQVERVRQLSYRVPSNNDSNAIVAVLDELAANRRLEAAVKTFQLARIELRKHTMGSDEYDRAATAYDAAIKGIAAALARVEGGK